MKKVKKSLWIFLAAVVMISTIAMVFAINISADTEGYYTYTVSNGEATITDVDTAISGDITIPSTLGGVPVTKIDEYAFNYCRNITGITIPMCITNIQYGAFSGCSSLASIIVESGNTVYNSFENCLIEKSTKTLVVGCINGYIPDNGTVVSIAEGAFHGYTNLTSVTIPACITSIDSAAFFGCQLMNLTVSDENEIYYSVDNCIIEKNTKTLVLGCASGVIPSDANIVTQIGRYAFAQRLYPSCKILTIPANIVSVGDNAFNNCYGIEEINILSGTENVGMAAFNACYSLEKLILPSTVSNIGNLSLFLCKSLETIVYCGTETEWNAVTKGNRWDMEAGEYSIQYHEYELSVIDNVHTYVCKYCDAVGETSPCVYDQEVVDDKYLASAGDCTNPATYYKSCVCGAKGSEPFEYGTAVHTYDQKVAKEEFIKHEASINRRALYYKSCKCGAKGTDVFLYSPDTPAVWDGSIATEFAGGSGTWDDPYQITSGAHLALLSEVINYGIDGEEYDLGGIYFKVMNDIDMNGIPFEPIGGELDYINCFSGYFNGNNKVISNLNLISEHGTYFYSVGLFGCVKNAVISNVILKDLYKTEGVTAKTYFNIGAIAGKAISSQIINCHVEFDLCFEACLPQSNTTIYAGGLVGFVLDGGLIKGCTYNGTMIIHGRSDSENNSLGNRVAVIAGGLVGRIDADEGNDSMIVTIEDCIVSGKLVLEGPNYHTGLGGILGVYYNGWKSVDQFSSNFIRIYFKNILVTADIDISKIDYSHTPENNQYAKVAGIAAWRGAGFVSFENCHYVGTLKGVGDDFKGLSSIGCKYGGMCADGAGSLSTYKNCSTSLDRFMTKAATTSNEVEYAENLFGQFDMDTCQVGTKAYHRVMRQTIENNINKLCDSGIDIPEEGYDTDYLSANFDVNDPWAEKSTLEWSFDEATGTLTIWGECDMPDYTWNSTPWNDHDRDIKTVIIKEGITRIGDSAFNGCYYTTSVTIPSSVTSIGMGAFDMCWELTEITIPSNVMRIEDYAFRGCGNLTSITVEEGNTVYHSSGNCLIETATNTLIQGCKNSEIPRYVTSIEEYAFYDCAGLTSIMIPSSVTRIGFSAFGSCSSLRTITVADGNPVYYSVGNCVIERATKTIVLGCMGSIIPTDENIATSIGNGAFSQMLYSGYGTLTIPSNIVKIGSEAFENCFISEIIISDGVESIENFAFSFCYNLSKVYVPSSVTSIGAGVFMYCEELTSIVFCGTEDEWASVTKGRDWDSNTGEYTVSYHEYESVEDDALNCKKCAICGDAIKHVFDKEIATEDYFAEGASCTQSAKYYMSCECGAKGGETFFYGKPSVHEYDKEVATATYKNTDADCENAASYYKSCVCGEKGSEIFYVGAPLGHSGGTATCTAQAVCGVCGKSYGNVLDHTYNKEVATETYFVSGATCTSGTKYYKSCVCGAKGSATFEIGEKLPHSYTQQNTSGNFLKTEASCTTKAVYYYSCSCGAKGEQTFETGDFYHPLNQEVVNDGFKKSDAICDSAAVYYKSCLCGMRGHETFTYGNALGHQGGTATCGEKAVCTVCNQPYGEPLSHTFDQEKIESKYLASAATCENAAKYYKSCVCGEIGTDTFESGEALAHTFDKKVSTEKYLKSAATCSAKAMYYYSCACGATGSEAFEFGEISEHSFDDGKVTLEPTVEAEGVKTFTCTLCGEEKTEAIEKLESVDSDNTDDTESEDIDTNDSESVDTDKGNENENPDKEKGCFGSIGLNAMFVIVALMIASFAILRKKEVE